MQHRIRSSAVILDENKNILLLKNKNKTTDEFYYITPGGGLDEGEDIFQNVERETLEETGLKIQAEKILYVREFVDLEHGQHNLEVYILAKTYAGKVNLNHPKADKVIEDVGWFKQSDLQDKTVYPEILKDQFWTDLESDFKNIKYLGQYHN